MDQQSPQENHPDSQGLDVSIPNNPLGGKTLIVGLRNPEFFPLPSEALKEAGPYDQVFIQPGIYEDKVFVDERPIQLVGAGRDHVQIFNRRGGPLYLQRVSGGTISGITFRYVGSDQNSAMNILDSTCTISECRIREGVLSGVVIYGSQCRPSLLNNEVCHNRESGIFSFSGAQPVLSHNMCFGNHHFGIAARDAGTHPEMTKNICRDNMLSGILLFHHASGTISDNFCHTNQHWGLVATPDCHTTPSLNLLASCNSLEDNIRGDVKITDQPLLDIGR